MRDSGTVVVTGASSQLGVFLLPRLSVEGYAVRALSRRVKGDEETAGGVTWANPDRPAAEPLDYLVSCGPIRLAGEWVRRCGDLKKAVVFSTSSVLSKPESADRKERDTVSGIAAEERRLEKLCLDRGIPLVLVRPTLIYGCGLDSNLSLLLRMGERTGFIPVSSQATGLRQPVHAADLAALAVAALRSDTDRIIRGEACGGSTLEFREMVKRLSACANRTVHVLQLPEKLLLALVFLASKVGPWRGINPQMVRRQAIDMAFDDTVFRKALAYDPRPFAPAPADFEIPADLTRYRPPR